MSEQQQQQHRDDEDIVGLGVRSTSPIRAPRYRVWAAMVEKMYKPERYLPVTDVHTVERVPGRHLYQEMNLYGEQLKANIYFDEQRSEIRSYMVGRDEIR